MKTIVSVLISILIMIQMSTPAMAASITPTDSSLAMVGYMTNEEGISIKIHGELLEAKAVQNQDVLIQQPIFIALQSCLEAIPQTHRTVDIHPMFI